MSRGCQKLWVKWTCILTLSKQAWYFIKKILTIRLQFITSSQWGFCENVLPSSLHRSISRRLSLWYSGYSYSPRGTTAVAQWYWAFFSVHHEVISRNACRDSGRIPDCLIIPSRTCKSRTSVYCRSLEHLWSLKYIYVLGLQAHEII